MWNRLLIAAIVTLLLTACASQKPVLYARGGGTP